MSTTSQSTLTPRGREMYALIERYLSSGLKQQAFCEDAGFSLTTFHYWLYRYRAEKGPKKGGVTPNGRSGFVALHPTKIAMSGRYGCELVLPNGMILRLAERPDAAWLLEVAEVR